MRPKEKEFGKFTFNVMITGDWACFTNQTFKTERVSYDIPTPCGLVGVLEHVIWKHPVIYRIKKIAVCNPVQFMNVKKNGVLQKGSLAKITNEMNGKDSSVCITNNIRLQRNTRYLYDVKYIVQVEAIIVDRKCDRDKADGVDVFAKWQEMILHNFKNKIYRRFPYLGISDCPANITYVPNFDEAVKQHMSEEMKGVCIDYGTMRYKVEYRNEDYPDNKDWEHPKFEQDSDTAFYHAVMENGIIDVEKSVKEEGVYRVERSL